MNSKVKKKTANQDYYPQQGYIQQKQKRNKDLPNKQNNLLKEILYPELKDNYHYENM